MRDCFEEVDQHAPTMKTHASSLSTLLPSEESIIYDSALEGLRHHLNGLQLLRYVKNQLSAKTLGKPSIKPYQLRDELKKVPGVRQI